MGRRAVVEWRESIDGTWEWQLVASNGEPVAGSHQGFRDETDAERGFLDAQRIMRLVSTGDRSRRVPIVEPPAVPAEPGGSTWQT